MHLDTPKVPKYFTTQCFVYGDATTDPVWGCRFVLSRLTLGLVPRSLGHASSSGTKRLASSICSTSMHHIDTKVLFE
jgi:hypothetical protein